MAQIRGEYKVYKLPYNIISGFFSLRGYIFLYILWSLLVMTDAYERGLNGGQAAWAARKYKGHRVLPHEIMEELGRNKFK